MRAVVSTLETAIQDLRFGARLLARSPWFTLVAVASLAIGLGSGVAMFTVMNAALFRPLPGRDTADIQRIYTSNSTGGRYGSSSFADFQSFTSAAPELFSGSCAATTVTGNMTVGSRPESLAGAVVNGGCFDALGLRPHLGRLLQRGDDVLTGEAPAVVISYALWRRGFGRDPGVAGTPIQLNGASAVIVGVAEPGFSGLSLDSGADFFAPPPLGPTLASPGVLVNRGARRFAVFVRLHAGVTAPQAADRLSVVAASLRAADPPAWTDTSGATRTVTVVPERQARFGGGNPNAPRDLAASALGAIAAVVAIACLNLATMILARGAARTRELNVRLALGASRWRLLRQLATESLLISVGSVVVGMFVVATALRLFDVYRPAVVPSFNLAIDWRVGGFAILLALVAPVLFGVAPAARALRLAIAEGLKGRPVSGRGRFLRVGPRELLLVVQVAVSVTLFVTGALFMRSLMPVGPGQPGPSTRLVAVVPLDLNTAATSAAESRAIASRLLEAADRIPDVDGPTAAALVPMTGSTMHMTGRVDDAPDPIRFDANVVAPGYFALTGVTERAGRSFDARDHDRAPAVAVVSESLAQQLWKTGAVVGRVLRFEDGPREVIGVVADVPYRSLVAASQPVLYLPLAQAPQRRWFLHARVRNEGTAMAALDHALRAVDARVVVGTPVTLGDYLDLARTPARITQWIGVAGGTVQLGLALMAIWGLVAYAVERRRAEMAIRIALGATPASVIRLVMRPGAWLVGIGTLLGSALASVAAEVLYSEFTGLTPIDLRVVPPAALVLLAIVLAATWLPARRVAAIAPATALRES